MICRKWKWLISWNAWMKICWLLFKKTFLLCLTLMENCCQENFGTNIKRININSKPKLGMCFFWKWILCSYFLNEYQGNVGDYCSISQRIKRRSIVCSYCHNGYQGNVGDYCSIWQRIKRRSQLVWFQDWRKKSHMPHVKCHRHLGIRRIWGGDTC